MAPSFGYYLRINMRFHRDWDYHLSRRIARYGRRLDRKCDIPIYFKWVPIEALFARHDFAFYNWVSYYNELVGRPPACLPHS
eukprot:5324330-Pyramimonas_sp.AAC.2